jgi:hypothetical protein
MTQLELPFLTRERAAVIDAARVAIERAQQSAAAARRWADADELCRLGMQLVDLLEENAAAVRAGQHCPRPVPSKNSRPLELAPASSSTSSAASSLGRCDITIKTFSRDVTHPPGRPATSADGCRPTGQVATKAGSDTEATR